MINLTSERDIIISLINKVLGNNKFSFILPYEENTVLEFRSENYKFLITIYEDKIESLLRIYDNGNVYIMQNYFANSSEEIKITFDCLLEKYNELNDFYKKEKSETRNNIVYTFERR
jgi:hypothetical protein